MTRSAIAAILLLATACVRASGAPATPQKTTPPVIFRFHSDEFWLNLHHVLYVLGRAAAKMPDASREAVAGAPAESQLWLPVLTEAEKSAWLAAIAFYAAGPSRKDAIFDAPLPAIADALTEAGAAADLARVSIDADIRTTLEAAAPAYRKAWWPAHHAIDSNWRDAISELVRRNGSSMLAFITRAYGMAWPTAGYAVHICAYSNSAGAYSTAGHLLVVSSADRAMRGLSGLEQTFHEGMHQWDKAINDLVFGEARRTGRTVPRFLSHGLIFFTTGEAMRSVAPDYVPYADANGVWERGALPLKAALEETWKPYLDGRGTRDEALAALIARAGS